jgi:hypothetical protein
MFPADSSVEFEKGATDWAHAHQGAPGGGSPDGAAAVDSKAAGTGLGNVSTGE